MAHVLILASDRQLANHTADYLRLKYYSVSVYIDPQTAVIGTDKQLPDLFVIDLHLANRSGIEFLYELRSYPDWQNIPAIITGPQHPAEIKMFQPAFDQLNVAVYLSAPLTSLSQLEAEIQNLLQPAAA